MSTYAIVVLAALAALAARGFPGSAVAIGLSICVIAAALDASYLIRRLNDRVLAHRRRLDRVVRVQWLGIVGIGSLGASLLGQLDPPPLQDSHPVVQAMAVGVVIAAATIYVSCLIDWYWVLPKVSGMVGLAPCERTGGEGFAGVTKIWLFDRATATTVVTFVLAGVPGYLAGSTGTSGSESAAWVILGSALAIGYNSVNNGLTAAFRYAFNPRLFVGDIIRVRAHPEDPDLKDAYVVDVSTQGSKYKLMEDMRRPGPTFISKGELLPIEDIASTNRSRHPRPPCPNVASCRAANWYCFRNPIAHVTREPAGVEPIPWQAPAEPPVLARPSGESESAELRSPSRRVFISHGFADNEMALDLARDLRAHGLDAQADLYSTPEDPFRKDIRKQLDEADAFLLLISAESQHSPQARFEMTEILKRAWADDTKAVVPVLIGSADPPGYLRDKPAVRLEPRSSGSAEALLRYLIEQPGMRGVRRTEAGETRLDRRLAELESTAASMADAEEEE